MADTLQYKIIQSGLFPPIPSLPQSRTLLIRGMSGQSENYSDMESLLTATDEEEHEYDSDTSSSSSSSSSDWDARTIISTVSTVLPPRQKTYKKMDIKPYLSQQFLIEFKKDPQIDITYDLYQLFYPYTNLQSLLFSQLQPYIESDYTKNKAFKNTKDESKYNETPKHNVKMNWDDIRSINRIKGLITKLLSSSGGNQRIKEEELYLMFTSPSPSEIIESLRFGSLSCLCDVHLDRFGRRSYHYQQSTAAGHKGRESQLHFYNHSRCPSSMFGDGDIVGLSDFIQEDTKSEIAEHHTIKSNIAKIHYHDNDVVMVNSVQNNGKMETEVRWQNYAIHSYLYNKTRLSMSQKQKQNIAVKHPMLHSINIRARARAIGQYGQSMIPHMLKHSKNTPTIIITKRTQRTNDNKINITKEGFLEKENIVSKQWMPYWCILRRNKQLLLYRYQKQKRFKNKTVECIDLNQIGVPISTSYDIMNKYFTFRLDAVNSDRCYVFRTRSEYERNCWLTEIDNMLDYENNVGQIHQKKHIDTVKQNDKTENCLIM